jgi:hypothetical protein
MGTRFRHKTLADPPKHYGGKNYKMGTDIEDKICAHLFLLICANLRNIQPLFCRQSTMAEAKEESG